MDLVFLEGIAAIVASIIVFFGSVMLLLAVVLGARLAYFIVGSISFGFIVIMGAVWSLSPLGPVGPMPDWEEFGHGATAAEIDFAPAGAYPGGPWREIDPEDDVDAALGSELETVSEDALADAIGDFDAYESPGDLELVENSTRVLEQDGDLYGAVTYAPEEGITGPDVIVVMERDPGDPLGPARMITGASVLLFLGHLFGLGRAEKRARRLAEQVAEGRR